MSTLSSKTKNRWFFFFAILLISGLLFGLGEVGVRLVRGKRLIISEIKENQCYVFSPDQRGWYSPQLHIPSARLNNIGSRGEDVNLAQVQREKKFVFLGDSFTFGYALTDVESIPFFFQQEGGLTKEQVLNYGNNAFGPGHMIGAYRYYQNRYQPFSAGDTVVMILIADDLTRYNPLYKGSALKNIFWVIKGKSAFVAWVWASTTQVIHDWKNRSHQKKNENDQQEKMNKQYYYNLLVNRWKDPFQSFEKELKENQRHLILVFYDYQRSVFTEAAQDFCRLYGFRCATNIYDYLKEMQKTKPGEMYAFDNLHPSAKANLLVARGLVRDFMGGSH